MHKIDGAGHLNNMFVWEDPLLNRPPTEITAEWLNAVQIELASVIEWSGLALAKNNNGQLLQALQAKFASIDPGGDYAVKLAVQADTYKAAAADVVGAPDAIVAAFFPAITGLVSAHGMMLYVRALAANATATPTFTPNNGTIAHKTIVKGNNLPLVAGDIAGAGYWMELRYDLTWDEWVLMNPAKGVVAASDDVGFIKIFSGPIVPDGHLALPVAQTNIYRNDFSKLHAVYEAQGYPWGVGDGASTFGMPYFAAGDVPLQGGVVGQGTVGEVIAHTHTYINEYGISGPGSAGPGIPISQSATNTSSTGGTKNLAAGRYVKYCIKY